MARHNAPRRLRRNRDTSPSATAATTEALPHGTHGTHGAHGGPDPTIAATLEVFPGLPDAVRLVSPDGASHAIGIRYQGPDLPDHHLYQARVPSGARLVNGMVALVARDTVVGVVVRDEAQYRNIGRLR